MVFWFDFLPGLGEARGGERNATSPLAHIVKKDKEKREASGWEQHSSYRLGNWKPLVWVLIKAEGYESFSNDTSSIPASQHATCLHSRASVRRAGGSAARLPAICCFLQLAGAGGARWLPVPGRFSRAIPRAREKEEGGWGVMYNPPVAL